MRYKARKKAIKFYDDYSLMMSEAKTKVEQLKEQDLKFRQNECFKKYQ